MGLKDWCDSWFGIPNDHGSESWFTSSIIDWGGLTDWANLSRLIEDNDYNHQGFTNKIKWNSTYEEALKVAKQNKKPVMLIVHAMECRSCRSFRDWFSRSSGIQQLSQQFSMVAVTPEQLPNNPELLKDGKYVPQVIFLTPNGKIIAQGERTTPDEGPKRFFPGTTPLVEAMKNVLNSKIV